MLLGDAINVTHFKSSNNVDIYIGQMDAEWCIRSVPNGGYVLAQIVQACIQQQRNTTTPDPIHVTAHFLSATSTSSFEIHVRVQKRGRNFTNLLAELLQDNATKVTSHLIFGALEPPSDSGKDAINLIPPSPYAHRLPLHHHPSKAPRKQLSDRYKFGSRFDATQEPEIVSRNAISSPQRTNSSTVGGGGLDYGIWCGFKDKGETVTLANLPFFADISTNAPVLLPKEYRQRLGRSWFPTMVMTIEYKFPLPKLSKDHSNRTIGIFSSTKFIHGTMGRQDMYTEIWTAPCDVGENVEVADGWRDKQFCLAVSTQMALTVPIAWNLAKGKL